MTRQLTALAALTVLSASLVGCVGPSEEDEVAEVQSALELEDGGMTLDAELPAFGDAAVQETPELTGDSIDDATEIAATPGMERYRVVLLWGALPKGNDNSEVPVPSDALDWSGTVSVSAGAIRVRRTLKFDRHDGLEPRQDPQTVAFRSHTLPHVDGLALDIMAPPDATVSFSTVTLDTSVELSQLIEQGRGAVPVGDGNGLAYAGYAVDDSCASGFLIGHWQTMRPNLGRFRGRVLSEDGDNLGHIRGIYGNSERFGPKRFFGKYIDADGDARGLVKGGYGDGDIAGRWGTKNPDNHGTMKGRYFHGLDDTDGRGFWLGRWREACETEAPVE